MNILTSHLHLVVALLLLALVISSACVTFHREPTTADLGSYHVSVRPFCAGSSTHSLTHRENDGSSRVLKYEFKCGDTMILIQDNTLNVNGKSYGPINESDQIAVDYGKVRVNSEVRAEVRR